MYLAAMLKKHGHQVDALIGEKPGDFIPILRKEKPQVLAFSAMTGGHYWAVNMAKELKKEFPDALTVMGGAHPTFVPEVIEKEGLDIICRGEADNAIVELAEAIDKGKPLDAIANFWVKKKNGEIVKNDVRPLVADMDSLPFPWRELYGRYPKVLNTQTQVFRAGRGCPFNCTFCFNHVYNDLYRGKGKPVRFRSPRNLMDEVHEVTSRIRTKNVFFIDDTFIMNKQWIRELTEIYEKEIKIPFTCLIRADLTDEETVKMIARAGCRSALFGLETGNEKLRNGLLRKGVTDEQIIRVAGYLKENHIIFRTFNMVGLPDETLEQALETVEINIKIGTDYPQIAVFIPYPGTELAEQSKRQGLLDPNYGPDDVIGTYHAGTPLKLPHAREVENLQYFFQTAVLIPWSFPIIKKLIHLPPNPLFRLWFAIMYGYVYIRVENRGWWETIVFGLKSLKYIVPSFFSGRTR